ncbi:MAG: cyclic nucleotide-binding domain-containing protein [Myxococcaceae bacterium]
MDLRKLKEKASEAFAKGKFAKAAEAYDEYCKADPKDLQARLRMGDAFAKAGKKEKAIESYAWAAEGFAKDGFLPRAIAASKLILELDPAHKGVQKMLADLYARKTSKTVASARPLPLANAPAAKNGSEAAPAPAAAKPYVSPPKKGAQLDPMAAPSPTNRADAIDLPDYEVPGEEPQTQGSTFVPMAEKGPSPTKNLDAIEIETDDGPKGRSTLEEVELDVGVTGVGTPAVPPPAAPEVPAPAPSAPPLELEVVAGAEEGEEVPIAGTPVYDLDSSIPDEAPKPMPPAVVEAPPAPLPVELAKPLPPPPAAVEAAPPAPVPSAPVYELEVVENEELEEIVPLTEQIEQSVDRKPKPQLEVLENQPTLEVVEPKPSLEVVSAPVEGEVELVEVSATEPPQVPPEPPMPAAPAEARDLNAPPGMKPKRPAEAEMSMRLEAISEPFGADEPGAVSARAEEIEPSPALRAPSTEGEGDSLSSRGKPKTDPEAWAAAAPEASPSSPRIWIPGSEEQSFESLGAAAQGESPEASTDLERGLAIFSSFEADDFMPTATRPAAPSEAARAAPPAAPPAPEDSAEVRRRISFTELELEGDSLLHAVESAAVAGASARGELQATPHEEAMEPLEESRQESGALPKIPLFSDLPEDAFIALFERCPLRRPTPSEVIIQQGSLGDAFYVICSGAVKVFRIEGERKREIAKLEEGAFFGEMALLSGSPRTASVEADGEDCQLLEISALILTELSAKYPPVAQALKKFCRQRLLQNVMASAPLFQPFSKGDRRDLVQKFRARDVNKGEVLIREGHPSDGMYVILSGEVDVKVGKTHVASLKEGDVFGEMSLLTKSAATASCVSAKRTSLLRLPKDDFDRLIMSHPQVLVLVSELTDARTKMNAALATPAAAPGSAPMV